MSPTDPQSIRQDLDVLLFGNVANAVLFGITTVQTYAYWTRRGSDHFSLVFLLLFCWVIDIMQLVLITFTIYMYVIVNAANAAESQKVIWTLPVLIFLTGASDVTVRGIYSYRIWILSRHSVFLVIALVTSSLLTLAFGWSERDAWSSHSKY
ncbi:hypothetical protein FOMPIDRAFT_82833 [Fomitopsis schrenkii]|uniref:Uncharacterized protein n=1 Tax=Fomitopsis schrenkii TaxID=2126942 RepID=S8G3K0_FOMSC|nr:hypothetical protein FOMPIDRAFT_82833 [Fomitopsis schrenkii]